MLWEFLKEKMLSRPSSKMQEEDANITYEEAVIFAESFGKKLRTPCCAILCQSELAAALALLSCFAAGVTAVPLSFRYGEAHCKRILRKIRPSAMITDVGGELRVLHLDIAEKKQGTLEEWPAAILCTSGTTGEPKGVMLSEENFLTNIRDICKYFKIEETDRILICRPLYHCAVLTGEFLVSLVKGLDIFFAPEKFDPVGILKLLKQERISVLCGTPSFFRLLCRFAGVNGCFALVKQIAVSGECMGKVCAEMISRTFYNAYVYHVYGLTEASPRVAYLPPAYFGALPESVGIPLPSVQVKIIDAAGKTVPHGVEGELCLKGKNVMMGYYRDPELTAQVLGADGWLRTGDIASMNESGFIKIKCRKDHMIIRAGMNIYPQEIENMLLSDKRTYEVLAYAIPDAMSGQKIGIKIVGNYRNKNEVLQLCRELLPPYAVPSVIEIVDELLKNASGKVIRNGKT